MLRISPSAGDDVICPSCQRAVQLKAPLEAKVVGPGREAEIEPKYQVWLAERRRGARRMLDLSFAACPACDSLLVGFTYGRGGPNSTQGVLWPKAAATPAVDDAVPAQIAQDYIEAVLVLEFSPRASATLSRRCLQAVLRDPNAANVKHGRLENEIDDASKSLPTDLRDLLHGVRRFGNFGAHPKEEPGTTQLLDVEPEEAGWVLSILDGLFDYYYVRPKQNRERLAALDKKDPNTKPKPPAP